MPTKGLLFVLLLATFAPFIEAQECKTKFVVVYTDGKNSQIGLTADQKKFWDREGAKKFKGMCLDYKEPNYIILWAAGLSGAELAKVNLDKFNLTRAAGQSSFSTASEGSPSGISRDAYMVSESVYFGPSGVVRGRADYWIMDTSKNTYPVIRKGQGYRDVPMGKMNGPGEKASASDMASTIADPVAAMENALKWLKKEKKL